MYNDRKHRCDSRAYTITNSDIDFEASHRAESGKADFLPLPEAQQLCAEHRWSPFPGWGERRKIYDLFMVNNRMGWLEIRPETLAAQVDYFVVVESAVTITGLPKPLSIKENWARFEKFRGQIIYHVLENPPGCEVDVGFRGPAEKCDVFTSTAIFGRREGCEDWGCDSDFGRG